jgi:BlaI family transcriptional regulator, penicillinase repressor
MEDVADLSDLQIAVMRVLWTRGEAPAADVQAALARERGLAITTVSTLLTRLEKRGVVRHRSEGRVFVYRATVSESHVRGSKLRALIRSLFAGDSSAVVSQLLTAGDLSSGDVDRMRRLIDDHPLRGNRRA